jgi:hypothetical protein
MSTTVDRPGPVATSAGSYAPGPDGTPVLLLPESPRRFGPVSRRLLARLLAVLAVVQVVGAVLVFAVDSPTARAAGLSMVFPGGGLLYDASPLAFLAVQVAMVVALVLWWGVSTHFAIPLVWALGVVAAALLADGPRVFVADGTHWGWAVPVVYALAAFVSGWMVWRVERRFRAKRAKISELNEYLRVATFPERVDGPREPDDMDAELLRWCYDFAFQPDDGLDGLDWGEQFHGGTQLRYQLNSISWAMSLYAANFLPNAPDHVTTALGKVIDKHTDLRVWRYWRTLNLLGNFDPDPDPIRRDNIMFSAFLGDVINTFEAATGSTRYDEPGSLTFVWTDGRTFAYDHHSLVEAVRDNYGRSKLGFFPCEPGWSFTVCNVMGAQSLRGHDALHGTSQWADLRDRWQRALDEEYLTPDGTYAHIRSNHVGLSWDTGEVPGGHYFANGTHRFVDILPDHARRARALELRGIVPKMAGMATMVRDGHLDLALPEEPERHHTSSSAVPSWLKVIGAARMAGQRALVDAAIEASARQCATGERWPAKPVKVTGSGHGSYMLVRWSFPLDLAELNLRGYVPPAGPVLDGFDHDRFLVTLARGSGDDRLDLWFRPIDDTVDADVGSGADIALVEFGFRQLEAGTTYRIHGTVGGAGAGDETGPDHAVDLDVTADDSGRVRVVVPMALTGEVRLVVERRP